MIINGLVMAIAAAIVAVPAIQLYLIDEEILELDREIAELEEKERKEREATNDDEHGRPHR